MVRPKLFQVFTGCVCGAHRSLTVLEASSPDDEFLAKCHILPAEVGHRRCNETAKVDLVWGFAMHLAHCLGIGVEGPCMCTSRRVS